jgi:hypothetical protein
MWNANAKSLRTQTKTLGIFVPRVFVKKQELAVALFLDFCLLAAKITQEVELGATNVATGNNLDVVDNRRVNGELSLHTHLKADLTHGKRLADTLAGAADNDALKNLNTRARALDDVDVDFDSVTGAEVGNVVTQCWCVYGVKNVHD